MAGSASRKRSAGHAPASKGGAAQLTLNLDHLVGADQPARDLGVTNAADEAWLNRRMTPQPLGTNSTAITFTGPIGGGRPVTFVAFTDPLYPASRAAQELARNQVGWSILSIPTGHMGIVTAAEPVAQILANLADGGPQRELAARQPKHSYKSDAILDASARTGNDIQLAKE